MYCPSTEVWIRSGKLCRMSRAQHATRTRPHTKGASLIRRDTCVYDLQSVPNLGALLSLISSVLLDWLRRLFDYTLLDGSSID